jgi:hypothetical protein
MQRTGFSLAKSRIMSDRFFAGQVKNLDRPVFCRFFTGLVKNVDRPVTGRSGPVRKVRPAGPVRSKKFRPVPTLGHIQVSMDVLLLGKLTLITTPADYYRRSLISPPLHFREGLLLQHVKEETPPIMHT